MQVIDRQVLPRSFALAESYVPSATAISVWLLITGTLFSIEILSAPVTVRVADFGFAVGIGLSVLKYRSVRFDRYTAVVSLFAIAILLSGLYNMATESDFSTANFAANYVRIVGLVIGAATIPRLFSESNPETLVKAVIGIMLGHFAIVSMDLFTIWPWPANDYEFMVAGLFLEPAWFGYWASLYLMFIGFIQWRASRRCVPIWLPPLAVLVALLVRSGVDSSDVRPSLSAIFSTFLFGMALLGHGFMLKRNGQQLATRLETVFFVAAVSLIVFVVVTTPAIRGDDSASSVGSRVSGIGEGASATDGSSRARIYGSWEFAFKSTQDSPIFGTGIGAENEKRIHQKYEDEFRYSPRPGTWQALATVLRSAGILGLLAYVAVLVAVLWRHKLWYFGLAWIAVGAFWGDAFASSYWLILFAAIGVASVSASGTTKHRTTTGDP